MYRFPVFPLAEVIITKQHSINIATPGFYPCIWLDLSVLDPKVFFTFWLDVLCQNPCLGEFPPRNCVHHWKTSLPSWTNLQKHFTPSHRLMMMKVNHKCLISPSLHYINHVSIQKFLLKYLLIFNSSCSYLRANCTAHQRQGQKGMWWGEDAGRPSYLSSLLHCLFWWMFLWRKWFMFQVRIIVFKLGCTACCTSSQTVGVEITIPWADDDS